MKWHHIILHVVIRQIKDLSRLSGENKVNGTTFLSDAILLSSDSHYTDSTRFLWLARNIHWFCACSVSFLSFFSSCLCMLMKQSEFMFTPQKLAMHMMLLLPSQELDHCSAWVTKPSTAPDKGLSWMSTCCMSRAAEAPGCPGVARLLYNIRLGTAQSNEHLCAVSQFIWRFH